MDKSCYSQSNLHAVHALAIRFPSDFYLTYIGAQAVQEVDSGLPGDPVQAGGHGGQDRVCAPDAAPGRRAHGPGTPRCLGPVRHRQEDRHGPRYTVSISSTSY